MIEDVVSSTPQTDATDAKEQDASGTVSADAFWTHSFAEQLNELEHNDLAELVGKMKEDNKPIEQTSIRALGYFIHKNGRLLPLSLEKNDTEEKDKEEEEEEEYDIGLISMEMDDHVLEQL
eukprot:917767_1